MNGTMPSIIMPDGIIDSNRTKAIMSPIMYHKVKEMGLIKNELFCGCEIKLRDDAPNYTIYMMNVDEVNRLNGEVL